MKKKAGKPTFFVVALLIAAFTFLTLFGFRTYFGDKENLYFKGVSDIRWGIDISGGVEAIFAPEEGAENVTSEEMDAAKQVITTRLVNKGITDHEVYADKAHNQIIVRFPWKSGEADFDPAAAVKELGEMAVLTFRRGASETKDSNPLILEGSVDIKSASPNYISADQNSGSQAGYVVSLELTDAGKSKFAAITGELAGSETPISIWMDDLIISAPTVNNRIDDGKAMITGSNFTREQVTELAEKINAGSLRFKMTVDESKLQIIPPTLGRQALDVMLMAGIIAFGLVCLMMLLRYRLPGAVACIALIGQVGGMLACVSGFFGGFNSFTLTIPGIAGIILSIGMGVDANVITSERIREELAVGKTLDGAIDAGYDNGFSAILDGNITVIIVAIVLMGAFGPPDSMAATIVSPLMFLFNSSITGSIYSFGYTLLMGVIFNFIMGVMASRLMLKGLSRFKPLRKLTFYGGAKNA